MVVIPKWAADGACVGSWLFDGHQTTLLALKGGLETRHHMHIRFNLASIQNEFFWLRGFLWMGATSVPYPNLHRIMCG
jgi:hypothetical protein